MTFPFRLQRHPTGFWKLVLFEGLGGRQIRVHFWPTGRKGVRRDVHGHRFRFVSIPFGTFVERRYETVEGRDRAVVNCADNGAVLEDGGRASVRLLRTISRPALVPYACGADELHDFEPTSSWPCASLVFLGRRRKARAPVFVEATNTGTRTEAQAQAQAQDG